MVVSPEGHAFAPHHLGPLEGTNTEKLYRDLCGYAVDGEQVTVFDEPHHRFPYTSKRQEAFEQRRKALGSSMGVGRLYCRGFIGRYDGDIYIRNDILDKFLDE